MHVCLITLTFIISQYFFNAAISLAFCFLDEQKTLAIDVDVLYDTVTFLSVPATNCNRHISSAEGKNGTITSPNYPNPYPGDMTCRFTFEGSGPERVQLRFTHMDLYFPGGNAADPHE